MNSTLRIQLLGDFLLVAGDAPVTALAVPRLQTLLSYLVLKRSAPQARSHLAFLLWPDSTEAQARANLRKLLHQLHRSIPAAEHFLLVDSQTVQWRPDAPFTLDVADFEAAIAQADRAGDPAAQQQALWEAIERYRGDLLPCCYDEWLLSERERLRQLFLSSLDRLIGLLERACDYGAAIGYAQQLLRHEPLREATYRQLMALQVLNGDRAGALRTYQICAGVLKRELGIEPSAATQASYRRLQAQEPVAPVRHNLPSQVTSFIGREKELATLGRLLARPDCRLVTIVGSGGIGKTRLALQVACGLLERFTDGVWVVNLAPITDPGLVVPTIAQALGVRVTGDRPPLDSLKDELRQRQMLLLLDNFEQVLGAAPVAGELLAAAPGLKVLVTSRTVLHLYGEREFVVPPLGLPDSIQMPQERLTHYEATRLFLDRAEAAQSGFTVAEADAQAIAAICRRLDGLPLAIELAAARSKLFAPQALLARLDKRLNLLTSGAQDLPARHQTLRGTIEWSHQLLNPMAQTLFRRLAVFVGGCTLAAAAAVLSFEFSALSSKGGNSKLKTQNPGLSRVEGSELDVLDGLASLVDQSLLKRAADLDGEPRFTMLETIREYALERLEASGEREALSQRHATFFLAMVEEAEPHFLDGEQAAWFKRLEREQDNLRAALAWALAGGDIELGTRMAAALWTFWWVRGYGAEGRAWLAEALRLSEAVTSASRAKLLLVCGNASLHDDEDRAATFGAQALALFRELDDAAGIDKALVHLADIAWRNGDYAQATELCSENLARFRERGDQQGIAATLHRLGDIARDQGDYVRASVLLEESLVIWQALGYQEGRAFVLNGLGDLALSQGNYELATQRYQSALLLLQEVGGQDGVAWVRRNLGRLAYLQGDMARAAQFLDASVAWFRDAGYEVGLAWVLHYRGMVAHAQGDDAQAAALLREAMILQRQEGHKARLVESLEGCAELAAYGQATQAARLLGAATAARAAIMAPPSPGEQTLYEQTVAAVRDQLGEATFAAAWAEGHAMSLEQAIAYALETIA